MITIRTARLSGDALVAGVEVSVFSGELDVSGGDQGIAGRLVTARGVPPLVGAGVAQGTALPQPEGRPAGWFSVADLLLAEPDGRPEGWFSVADLLLGQPRAQAGRVTWRMRQARRRRLAARRESRQRALRRRAMLARLEGV